MWDTLLEQQRAGLQRLDAVARGLSLGEGGARQYCRRNNNGKTGQQHKVRPLFARAASSGYGPCILRHESLVGTIDLKNPVKSLDQLYMQATALEGLLRRKVQQWAVNAKGHFMPDLAGARGTSIDGGIERIGDFVSWEALLAGAVDIKKVRWAGIKRDRRSIEKIRRAYRGDVSRLCDVCRQSIVFATVADLADCLESMSSDPDVVILRCKNRLAEDYCSWSSAGYRDVSINLRITTEWSKRLGVETHVAEVQLLLRSFAVMKNADGHAKYLKWRDLKGE